MITFEFKYDTLEVTNSEKYLNKCCEISNLSSYNANILKTLIATKDKALALTFINSENNILKTISALILQNENIEHPKHIFEIHNGKAILFTKVPIVRAFTELKPLYDLIKGYDCYILGGAARYCLSTAKNPFPFDDIDVYCKDIETYKLVHDVLTVNHFEIKLKNEIAIFYKPNPYYPALPGEVNLIHPKVVGKMVTEGPIETILANFDFSICRAAILNENEGLVDHDFIEDEKNKFLRIKNIHCPPSSAIRMAKYYRKGYWSKPIEVMKLFRDWDERQQDYKDKLNNGIDKINAKEERLSDEEKLELYRMMCVD